MITLKDIGTSATHSRWILKESSALALSQIAQTHDLPIHLIHLLLSRGIDPQDFDTFLNPSLATTTPDPFHLKDMEKGVNRVAEALKKDQKITVFGDYDVDGATSASSLVLFFRSLGKDIDYYIPHREKEGYGLNKAALSKIKESGGQLVITVDCGASSFDALEHAQAIGLEVIVLDHHLGTESMPPCTALINPNRADETSELTNLAAAGVTFLFLVALRKTLRESGWFQTHPEPKLSEILPLTAFGTVCDVMPLTGFNRTLVKQGLKALEHTQNPGLLALLKEGALTPPYQGHHFGFILGPRINAAGRIDDASLGTKLLTQKALSPETTALAQELSRLNQERQVLERQALETAFARLEQEEESSVICLAEPGWPQGVIGLVAGRLKERFHTPAFAITWLEDGTGKGSARSIKGFDIGACIQQAVAKGLLTQGGGHPMAGGFSLTQDQFEPFKDFLKKATQNLNRERVFEIDKILSLDAITPQTLQEISQLEPFGPGTPRPLFLFKNCQVKHSVIMGQNHLRLSLSNGLSKTKTAVLFKAFDGPLGTLFMENPQQSFDIIGTLKENHFQGTTTLQLLVEDARLSHDH